MKSRRSLGVVLTGALVSGFLLFFLVSRNTTAKFTQDTPPNRSPERPGATRLEVPPPPTVQQPSVAAESAPIDDSPLTRRVRELLDSLRNVAKKIGVGSSLGDIRKSTAQPDSLIWELRVLLHSNPNAAGLVKAFLQDANELIQARIFVILALAYPQDAAITQLLADIVAKPSDVRLAIVACLCYDTTGADGIGKTWNKVFSYLGLLDLGPGYSRSGRFEFLPDNGRDYPNLYRPTVTTANLAPIRSAFIEMLDRGDLGDIRSRLTRTVWNLIRRRTDIEATDRQKFKSIVERSFAQEDKAWRSAMDVLMNMQDVDKQPDVGVFAKNFETRTTTAKLMILDELTRIDPIAIFLPPYSDSLRECIDGLGVVENTAEQNGFGYVRFCWALSVHWPEVSVSQQTLSNHPNALVRSRIVEAMAAHSSQRALPGELAKRVMGLGKLMLADSEAKIAIGAVEVLISLCRLRSDSISKQEYEALRGQIRSALSSIRQRALSAEEAALLANAASHFAKLE